MIIQRTDVAGVAVLSMSTPDRAVNVIDMELFREFAEIYNEVAKDEEVRALVLMSGKSGSFGVGADVDWVSELAMSIDGPARVEKIHALMSDLYWSAKPLVTAIDGPALGGALELALASRLIVASVGSTFGLPEVRLGLMPGGGGTVLLPRLVEPSLAVDLLTKGRSIDSSDAEHLGLVSKVTTPEHLYNSALELALELAGETRTAWHGRDDIAEAATSTHRTPGRAVDRILASVRFAAGHSLEEGLREERRLFFDQIRTAEARSGIHLFRAERELKRIANTWQSDCASVGVVGAGQMGAGIAATAAVHGLDTRLRDINRASLTRAKGVFEKVRARRPASRDRVIGGWKADDRWDGFEHLDVIIEAVFEAKDLKLDVLRDLSGLAKPGALLASNTSALSITELAAAVTLPSRFLGMHFFSPVDRMRIVELIPHVDTSARDLGRAMALARQMGKVPIVVADTPGFFTSRVYARWLAEGVLLLLDGLAPDEIDEAARTMGFAAGPMVAIDEATVDLVLAASVAQVMEMIMAPRVDVQAVKGALEALRSAGARGRRHGSGFYLYDEATVRTMPNPGIHDILSVVSGPPSDTDAGSRLLLAFVSEALLCWDEGILCHPDDADVASVAGIGFPAHLGGPFRLADERGPQYLVAELSRLGSRAFPTGSTLVALAATGGTFAAQARTPRPPMTLGSQ